MFSLNVSCAVCKKAFQNADTISSTSCGHIFHYSCLNGSRIISTLCPVCRYNNPGNHPLYLNFENVLGYESVVKDLKAKLQSCENKNKKYEEEMEQKVKKIDDVKRLYNISEQWRAELEYKIQILKQQNEQQNGKHLLALCSKSDENKMLRNHIEVLEKDNVVENLFENYEKLISENLKLKQNLEENEMLRLMLNQRLAMQEHKLKYFSLELEKQFTENFKKESEQENSKNDSAVTQKNRNRGQGNKRARESKNISVIEKNENVELTAEPFRVTQSHDFRVVILDFPKKNLVYPLKETVLLLALKMNITLQNEDILSANILKPRNRHLNPTKTIIIAEFKNIEIKTQFLSFRNRLKFDTSFKFIKLKEYIDEKIYSVLIYANRKLRGNFYEYIECKDNKVIAKKKLTDTEEIVIKNQKHVDEIVRSQQNTKPEITDYVSNSINNSFESFVLFD